MRRSFLEKEAFNIKGSRLDIAHPVRDDTFLGSIMAILENQFKFGNVAFKPGDVFLDLGCNIGIISCYVAKIYPFIRVVGFDASTISINCAKINSLKNNLINTEFYNLGIGIKNQKNVEFLSNSKEITGLIRADLDSENRTDSYTCDVVTLSDIVDSKILCIENIKYLKVDIEGDEFDLFNYLFNERSDILDKIEYLHLEIHKMKDDLIIKTLKEKVINRFGQKLLS